MAPLVTRRRLALVLATVGGICSSTTEAGSGTEEPTREMCSDNYPPVACSTIAGVCGTAGARKLKVGDMAEVCIGFQSTNDNDLASAQKAVFQIKVDKYSRLRVTACAPLPQRCSPFQNCRQPISQLSALQNDCASPPLGLLGSICAVCPYPCRRAARMHAQPRRPASRRLPSTHPPPDLHLRCYSDLCNLVHQLD